MKDFLPNLFRPHEKNNYRAGLLHHKSLLWVTLILFFGGLILSTFKVNFPSVLGTSVDISSQKLLLLTNKQREENGLRALALNPKLSQAAANKAEDMFAKNYWAHNSPDGKTPWVFIKGAGYNYVYAGENLARGFDTTEDVLSAWMASPKHRANVLSENYQDVGFAVKTGRLNGEETVLVVEEFGDTNLPQVASVPSKQSLAVSTSSNQAFSSSFIKSLSFSSNLDRIILILFIFALALDLVVVERKKIVRFVGHNIDHIFFLLLILLLIGVLSKGVII